MTEIKNIKHYDLEDRTEGFARKVRIFVKKAPKTLANYEDCKQLVRASGSVGANYIEANDSLSKKDCDYSGHLRKYRRDKAVPPYRME